MSAPLPAPPADPAWLPHRYDPQYDAVHFRHVPRARHDILTFLTDDHLGPGEAVVIRREEALAAMPAPAPIHFIFHSAYCCSTMLARAMDLPGHAMGLKEPVILNDLVGWRHRGAEGRQVAMVLDHSLRLLARPYAPGECVIVKPSNLVNPMIPALLAMRPQARALLLFAPLDEFLASIARKGMWGRLWVRDLLAKFLPEGIIDLGLAGDDYLRLTDLQAAAVGWLAQHALFAKVAAQFGAERIATLDSRRLTADPQPVFAAVAAHFGLGLSPQELQAVVNGPAFTSDSKTRAQFGREERATNYQDGRALHADEIDMVGAWAKTLADNAGIAMTLPFAIGER
jgi:hypothetical protein